MGMRGNKCIQSSTGSKAVNDGFCIIIMSEKENKQPVLQEGVYSKKNNKKTPTDLIIQLLFIVCISSQLRGKKISPVLSHSD